MNREITNFLDLLVPMLYFWLYRVRDNRPLEVSSGVVSQSERSLISEPAGERDSLSTGDSARARHKLRNSVSRFIQPRSLLGRSLKGCSERLKSQKESPGVPLSFFTLTWGRSQDLTQTGALGASPGNTALVAW